MKLIFSLLFLFTTIYSCQSNYSKIIESYPNGMKKLEINYKSKKDIKGDSLINGKKLLFDSLGNLAQTDDYSNGKLNGEEIWYYPTGRVWKITKLRNDSAYGFEYEFGETGDTLIAMVHYGRSINGMFYKKWLPNKIILTGNYGDTDRNFVIWKWFDKNGRLLKSELDSGSNLENDLKKFITPE